MCGGMGAGLGAGRLFLFAAPDFRAPLPAFGEDGGRLVVSVNLEVVAAGEQGAFGADRHGCGRGLDIVLTRWRN